MGRDEIPGGQRTSKRGFAGLFIRRECWTLSLRGKLLCLALILIAPALLGWRAYPFLARNGPVHEGALVVEGWIPIDTMEQVFDEFKNHRYRRLLIVQSTDVDNDPYENRRTKLVELGIPSPLIDTVLYTESRRDRTYHSARAVYDWMDSHGLAGSPLDVATVGPHARRSWITYQKTFGRSDIGILALDDTAYDSARWWRTSEGVREVLGEIIAYMYAKFFFAWK